MEKLDSGRSGRPRKPEYEKRGKANSVRLLPDQEKYLTKVQARLLANTRAEAFDEIIRLSMYYDYLKERRKAESVPKEKKPLPTTLDNLEKILLDAMRSVETLKKEQEEKHALALVQDQKVESNG